MIMSFAQRSVIGKITIDLLEMSYDVTIQNWLYNKRVTIIAKPDYQESPVKREIVIHIYLTYLEFYIDSNFKKNTMQYTDRATAALVGGEVCQMIQNKQIL